MISRRLFLRKTAAAGAAGATIAIPVVAKAEAELNARERFKHHLAELKKAAEELDPRIGYWSEGLSPSDDMKCSIAISAYRVTGRYEGDGKYESSSLSGLGRPAIYDVVLLPERIDGQRMFSVRTSMDRMTLAEPRLNTFIGRRLA